jgi:exopolysaccharide biosynthesis predicted pyruvyltransferase EpsI
VLVRQLREQAHRTVQSVLAPGSRCALLGYPNHSNPGDHAIWLGAKSILAQLRVEVVYECSWRDYSRAALAAAVDGGAQIVFTGGGNFGDLWPATHALRERVLEEFRGVRIVQLPQSVHFTRADNLARTSKLLARQGNVALVVRDRRSLGLARRSFDTEVLLGPDLGFACPLELPRSDRPVVDIAWIAREDREAKAGRPVDVPRGVWRVDWNLREREPAALEGEPSVPRPVLELIERNRALTKAGSSCWRELAEVRAQLTRWRLARACRLLRRGRVIVTDSLHAHILGLMLGIPTVVTDNNYGKLRSTVDTFTGRAPHAHWAETHQEALALATELVSGRSLVLR